MKWAVALSIAAMLSCGKEDPRRFLERRLADHTIHYVTEIGSNVYQSAHLRIQTDNYSHLHCAGPYAFTFSEKENRFCRELRHSERVVEFGLKYDSLSPDIDIWTVGRMTQTRTGSWVMLEIKTYDNIPTKRESDLDRDRL